jgi:rSAM/selenodomain-associated transferase 1
MNLARSALIIFVKEPIAGKVKTRLAATLGDRAAVEVYNRLLSHTDTITREFDRFVFFSGNKDGFTQFRTGVWHRQSGGDLGVRMLNAFKQVFSTGYEKVVIIGSDCAELKTEVVETAFEALNDDVIVLGPALDGGYYLLGMTSVHESLFTGMAWSTDSVAAETRKRAISVGLDVHELPTLGDIDTEKDLKASGW